MIENDGDSLIWRYNTSLAIPYCGHDTQKLNWAMYALVVLNAFSVVINVIHMLILSRITSLRGSGYYHILLHIAASDIYFSLVVICKMVWNDPSHFSNTSRMGFVVYFIYLDVAAYGRYGILTAASLERYYALCRSLHYFSTFTNRIHIWLLMVWFVSVLVAALRGELSYDTLCFDNIFGPIALSRKSLAIKTAAVYIPSLTTAILLTRVNVELFRMRKKSSTVNEKQVKRSTYYLISISALFYLSVIPSGVFFLVYWSTSTSDKYKLSAGFYISPIFVSSVYGLINVVIYWCMSAAYRKAARSAVSCKNKVGVTEHINAAGNLA